MNKIIEQSISYPQVVKVFAEKYIMALYSSGWYEKNKIQDPAYSYFFVHERVYGRYLENCYKMPKELKNLFTENEQKGNRETRKRENNHCLNNSESAMRFVWKLDCDSVKKVVCAFRSHADPGLQAAASAADPSRIRCSDVMMI